MIFGISWRNQLRCIRSSLHDLRPGCPAIVSFFDFLKLARLVRILSLLLRIGLLNFYNKLVI